MQKWLPEDRPGEERILKRLKRTGKLFGFLRRHRLEIFDYDMHEKLASIYRGAGTPPRPPCLLCMGVLLQSYADVSDAEAVELSAVDKRWQLVLGTLGSDSPAFSQGALQSFRQRLIDFDMDKEILTRTIEIARQSRDFDWKKLPKEVRVGVDSRPLVTAGRVEDTYNLLGHAARKIAECAAKETGKTFEEICNEAQAPMLMASSVKAGLDIDWSDRAEKKTAFAILVTQAQNVSQWARENIGDDMNVLTRFYLDTFDQVYEQNVDEKEGQILVRKGVARDRRISIEDADARHGRKSAKKTINGYKEHIATDLDNGLVIACEVLPANAPEGDAGPTLKKEINAQGFRIKQLAIDRAYVSHPFVDEIEQEGGEIVAKPWALRNVRNPGLFTKDDFRIDLNTMEITCPASHIEKIEIGTAVNFDANKCDVCPLREKCTTVRQGRGRSVLIANDEARQIRFRQLQKTTAGRAKLRERVSVEHRQAQTGARKGNRARYLGSRKNTFHLRMAGGIVNLHAALRTETVLNQMAA